MRCLDLFCGAGGAAMGYHQAGFEVVGWDIEHHPDYPFEHHVGDALEVLADVDYVRSFDLVHASPPCQAYSTATRDRSRHPDLVAPVRQLLEAAGVPYIIENVPQAPLRDPVLLCGSSFGLRVRRHRAFESTHQLAAPICRHKEAGPVVGVYGDHPDRREYRRPDGSRRGAKATSVTDAQNAMGIPWMGWKDLAEAIPPAYTEHLGRQVAGHLEPRPVQGSSTSREGVA